MNPETNSLEQFFFELVSRHYTHAIGLRDPQVSNYVAHLLTEFCSTEQLYKIRDCSGRPLHDVGELLLESDPIFGRAPSFDRERQVRKHIGDYTLFFTGMFPESLNDPRMRRQRVDSLLDFIKAGKESYYIVSKFEYFEYQKVAPLFKQLSAHFEEAVTGLNMVKNELEVMQHPIPRRTPEILM
jgi:hypothetical protein